MHLETTVYWLAAEMAPLQSSGEQGDSPPAALPRDLMPHTPSLNTLFYGDNLAILREHIDDESVDLIYLDPPFNSNANYNILFHAPGGEQSQSQIEAFEDTWHWNLTAERAYAEVLQSGNSDAANLLKAMREFLGTNDMMAYLAMMAVRLIELHRVLKPTGSLYLHCDPTASHYLKLLLDAVFGTNRFVNEISWRRTTAKADYKQGARHFPRVRDIILRYAKGDAFSYIQPFAEYSAEYVSSKYRNKEADGRAFRLGDLTAAKPGGETTYAWRVKRPIGGRWEADLDGEHQSPLDGWEYKGVTPYSGRIWVYNEARMREVETAGRLRYTSTGFPEYKRYLDEMPGVPVGDDWDDIRPINSQAQERLGYPTQKPLALLERILAASSNEGDVVLDPFCGCGTTVHAAQKMGRRWVGIDVTHLAVGLIQRRLRDAFPMAEFQVLGTPRDLDAAKALAEADKHQFQLWALSMIDNAVPYKGGRKGADGGVDGYVYFQTASSVDHGSKQVTGKAIVSIKGGGVTDSQVKDLITTIDHESAQMGLFVTLLPPTKPMVARAAAAGFFEAAGKSYPKVQILTVEQLFDGKRPVMPWLDPSVFKKAKREAAPTGQGELEV